MTDSNREYKFVDAGDIDLDEEVVLDSHGRRITEAVAQEWAEDAHRQMHDKTASLGRSSARDEQQAGGHDAGRGEGDQRQ